MIVGTAVPTNLVETPVPPIIVGTTLILFLAGNMGFPANF